MNKKFLVLFAAVALLLAAVPASLLIGGARERSDTQGGTTTAAAGETEGVQDSENTGEQTTGSQTGETGETPSFEVAFGVGDKADFGAVDATEDAQVDQSTQPSENTQPSQKENTGGAQDATDSESGMPDRLLTYEEFLALSNEDQQAYFFLFADPLDYAQWLRQAQQDYEDGKTSIIVTGPVDFGDIAP